MYTYIYIYNFNGNYGNEDHSLTYCMTARFLIENIQHLKGSCDTKHEKKEMLLRQCCGTAESRDETIHS